MRNNRINNLNSNPQIGLDVVNKNHVDLVVRKSDLTFIYIVFKPPFPSFGPRTQNYERKNCGGPPKYYTTRDLYYLGYYKNRIYWLFYYTLFWRKQRQTHVTRNLNWYCYWKSCIARATNRLVSYLLEDNQPICRLRWFPKCAVGY